MSAVLEVADYLSYGVVCVYRYLSLRSQTIGLREKNSDVNVADVTSNGVKVGVVQLDWHDELFHSFLHVWETRRQCARRLTLKRTPIGLVYPLAHTSNDQKNRSGGIMQA